MSQKDDSENEIWGYKPLEKKKKRHESPSEPARVSKRRCTFRRTSKTDTCSSVKSPHNKVETEIKDCCVVASSSIDVPQKSSSARGTTTTTDSDAEAPSGGFCPVCQMPFSILLVQTQRWHVAECLDIQRETCKECPNGLRCSSTIPNHYRKFNHTFLAQSRANNEMALIGVSQQAGSNRKASPGCLPELIIDSDVGGSHLDTSRSNLSVLSNDSASTQNTLTGTPPSKLSNGLLLLRSPGPEDLKKKKGWSPSPKKQKAVSVSQESRKDLSSSPVKAESGGKACEGLLQSPPSPEIDDAISYSPLSEFPAEIEAANSKLKKCLFNNDASENEREDSVLLFGDGFSSEDELLNEFLDHFEANNVQVKEHASSVTQLDSVALAPPTNQIASSSGADHRVESTGDKESHGRSTCLMGPCKNSIQSPHRIVLDRLRETLQSSDSLHLKDLTVSSVGSDQRHAASSKVPSSQTPTVQRSETMSPQKGQSKAGQASCLKQTDIGVFFGLKPLKKQEKEAQSGPHELNTASIPVLDETSRRRQREPRKERQRTSKADTAADPSQSTDHSNVVHAGKGRSRAWGGRRWNRVNADGEVELPRCPFYKKIPGTKFVIDAFNYGDIEGIAAYFLTHFHSDHYGGLTKNSTLPIYCNRITGNLVKSKLKVAERYVHILPMNTQVTVEGVKVILLDANHCPGAAMLLFFLPDGQTVLHTGDFRADPSMETYPELIGCRVQTLYLDTTYCSPEYTFPGQQEVIRFAASTAFECVTLNPRTLVVCGSYSVGKEKVFLALAEVLGTKVCLSRDKFNTMCCLESEQVRRCITTDWKAAQVHVLPMMQLTFKKLQDHLSRFSGQYDRLVAFKPTGWTFSQQADSVADIQPQISGNISIYGVPYSEHSSFLEMKRFVQWLRPLKIIPTVNNGSWTSRKAMEKNFSEWLLETKAKL